MLNEADTRAKLIDPKLRQCGWSEERIRRDVYITPGMIVDERGKRQEGKKPDYILYARPSIPIAVVEAKEESKGALDGMQQAKDYAAALGCPFAYSTNGHKIEEFDFTTKRQRTVQSFPTPDELYRRYLEFAFTTREKSAGAEPERIQEGPVPYDIVGKEKLAALEYPYHVAAGGKKPRYYQEPAINRIVEAILEGRKRILLAMATGTGKTYVAFQVVWKLVKSGYFRRVLYVADRVFLRDQAWTEFSPFGDARAVITEGKTPRHRNVYFSIYQALYSGDEHLRIYQKYPRDFFDLVIIDECHRSGYGTWREILDYFGKAVHLGMTATPKRTDNIDTYAYFGDPVYSYTMGQGIEDGFLAPFQIYRTFTNVDREGLHLQDALHQGARVYIPEGGEDEEPYSLREIYTLEDFEREIVLPDRTRKICEHLAGLLQTFGPMQKTIIFCVNMGHAALVAKELQSRFACLGHDDYAVRIVAEEPSAKDLYEKFRDSEKATPVVATTVDLLTTGVDIPSVRNVVFLKPVGSKVYFKQHIGRGCRIDTIAGKYMFRIIDYVNATRLLDEWDYPSGGKPERIVEGPFDLELEGYIVHAKTDEPVPAVKVVAQLGPNVQRLSRSNERGRFMLERLPHSPITLTLSKGGFRSRSLTITAGEQPGPLVIELKPEKPPRQKIVLEGVEVYVAEETEIFISASGKTLTEAEYREYSREGVLKRVANLDGLYEIWLDRERRRRFLDELQAESIFPRLLAGILKMPDADALDVIAHIAFGVPMLTRDERARAFLNAKHRVISALGQKAQEVVLSLLDKYRAGGIEQITRPEIFEVPPFDKLGYLRGVAGIFGGMENLKRAISLLERGIYETARVST